LKEFLTIDELSDYLNVKKSTLYSMVEGGKLPHYRIGRLIRVKQRDVDLWLEGHKRDSINENGKGRSVLKAVNRRKVDTDSIVRKSIEEIKGLKYTFPNGRPDQIKGLGKEV
jgi:excisionase family DNA binding protein